MTRAPKFTQDDLYRCRGCGSWRLKVKSLAYLQQCHTCRLRHLQAEIARLRNQQEVPAK